MIVHYTDFQKIQFPVYPLHSDNWFLQDGLLSIDGLVLDERRLPGKSLGVRRLQSGRTGLYKLKKPVFNLQQLIHSKNKHFIDSKGTPFTYEKTKLSKLKPYKIKRVEQKGTASLMWLSGVTFPITLERPPPYNYRFARILHIRDAPWLLYDFSDKMTKETYRKV